MGTLRKYLAKPEFSILLILAAMLVLAAVLQRNFFEAKALNRTLNAFTPLILLAMGQAVVIISGGLECKRSGMKNAVASDAVATPKLIAICCIVLAMVLALLAWSSATSA